MTREQLLLTSLAEECAEVAQRCTKAVRFGMDDAQHGYSNNRERLVSELTDLHAVAEMLGLLQEIKGSAMSAKKEKVEKYLRYSRELGVLDEVAR